MKSEFKKCKYCKSEIDRKAKVCPVCRRAQKSHGLLIVVIFLLLISIGVLTTLTQFTQPADDKYITLEEYNQIQSGMSYEEVQKIVGSKGTVSAESNVAGLTTFIVTWYANPNLGTNANVTFQNDQVVLKAQVGLK